MAAAIGAGLPVSEPTGNMIVDIGGGTTEVAVISLGGIVVSQSIRVGGDELDEAIIEHVKREYKLMIGSADGRRSEARDRLRLRAARGSRAAEIRGRDLVTGLPKTVVVSSERRGARRRWRCRSRRSSTPSSQTLDKTPPELASDVMDRGIVMAGGGSLLRGMCERVREETQMPVNLAESPLTCVAVGSGRLARGVRRDPPCQPVVRQPPPQRPAQLHVLTLPPALTAEPAGNLARCSC